MIENAGSKIKKIISIISYVESGFSILIGILLMFLSDSFERQGHSDGMAAGLFLLGLVVCLLMPGVIRIKYLFFQAYGELVENSAECSEHLKDIKKLLENAKVDEPRTPNVSDSEA